MTTKNKLKWFREGCDPHEDMYLISVDQARTEDDDVNTDAAVAWIKIAYDRTRFYGGRGGEGTSRPDSYVAYVQDTKPGRQHRGIVITEGTNAVAYVGGLFSDRSDRSFTSLRAAKQAIAAYLEKRAHVGHKGGECKRCDAADTKLAEIFDDEFRGPAPETLAAVNTAIVNGGKS